MRFDFAAAVITARPPAALPVKAILAIFMCEASKAPTGAAPAWMLITRGGNPAFRFLVGLEGDVLLYMDAYLVDQITISSESQRTLLTRLEDESVASSHCRGHLPGSKNMRAVPCTNASADA